MLEELLLQAAKACAYYACLLILLRLAGKRLAGQTTTFDLIVLITLGVVLQTSALQQGPWNAIVFVATVFALHRLLAMLCARSIRARHLIRGKPRALIRMARSSSERSSRKASRGQSCSRGYASSGTRIPTR